jgi:DNA-directed RNA polymerase subunit RPC12/RpoP
MHMKIEFLHKFACFDCQVAFKRRAIEDTSSSSAHQADSEIIHKCPNCNHRMAFMGRNFATPSKANSSAWFAAKSLWEAGFRFVGSGAHSDSALPKSKAAVAEFIEQNSEHKQKVGNQQQWAKYA